MNKSKLNAQQLLAAVNCRDNRPTVLPGTNVILDDAARKEWFDLVCERMEKHGIKEPLQIKEFCDVAGVPD